MWGDKACVTGEGRHMDFDIRALMEHTGIIAQSYLLNGNIISRQRIKIRSVEQAEGGAGKKEVCVDSLYVIPAGSLESLGQLWEYEQAGCSGVVLTAPAFNGALGYYDGNMIVTEAITSHTPSEVAGALSNTIIQECQDICEKIIDMNRYLSSNTLNRQDMMELLEYFKQLTGNPIGVFDEMFHCIAATDEILLQMKYLCTLPNKVYLDSKYLNRHFVRHRIVLPLENEGPGTGKREKECSMVSFPVSFRKKVRAYLSIPQIYQNVPDLNDFKIEITATAILGQIKHDLALQEAEERNIDNFFYNLIYRKDLAPEELESQAGRFGFGGGRCCVMILKYVCEEEIFNTPECFNPSQISSREDRVFLIISRIAAEVSGRVLPGRIDGKIMILWKTGQDGEAGAGLIEKFYRQIKKEMKGQFRKVILQAGVGNGAEQVSKIRESYENAGTALAYGQMVYGENKDCMIMYRDTMILRLFGSISSKKKLEELVPRGLFAVREYDESHGSNLLETLSVYFDCNCNSRQSAAAMDVHYKTMTYRINQIRELCDMDLSDSDMRLHYALGVRILRLMLKSEKEL